MKHYNWQFFNDANNVNAADKEMGDPVNESMEMEETTNAYKKSYSVSPKWIQ